MQHTHRYNKVRFIYVNGHQNYLIGPSNEHRNVSKKSEIMSQENNYNSHHYRHHHKTGLNCLQCQENIFNIHDNIVFNMVHIANGVPLYSLRHEDAISILFSMKCQKVAKGWTFYVGYTSGILCHSILFLSCVFCDLSESIEMSCIDTWSILFVKAGPPMPNLLFIAGFLPSSDFCV